MVVCTRAPLSIMTYVLVSVAATKSKTMRQNNCVRVVEKSMTMRQDNCVRVVVENQSASLAFPYTQAIKSNYCLPAI